MSFRRLRKRIALKCVPHVQHDYFAYSTNEIIVLWRCLCLSSAISLHCLSSLSRWFSASFFQVTRSSLCVMGISFLLIVSGLKILRGTQFPLRAHSQSFMVHLHLEFYQALSSSMLNKKWPAFHWGILLYEIFFVRICSSFNKFQLPWYSIYLKI